MTRFLRGLACLVFLAISATSSAEDGLVIQFTISEVPDAANEKRTYTNAILMRFDEEVSFDLNDLYVLKIRSRSESDRSVNLLISLKDIVDGKPYYVGADAVTVAIGGQASVRFSKYDTSYEVSIDTSYGTIPQG